MTSEPVALLILNSFNFFDMISFVMFMSFKRTSKGNNEQLSELFKEEVVVKQDHLIIAGDF